MVDRDNRDKAVRFIEHYLARGTNGHKLGAALLGMRHEVEALPDHDSAIPAVGARLWQYVPRSSRARHDLRGEGTVQDAADLRDHQREEFERCVLFLKSDREIEWPLDMWDTGETMRSAPDPGTILVMLGAGVAGMTSIILLACRLWGGGIALAALCAGLAGLFWLLAKGERQRRRTEMDGIGDPSAFPFLAWPDYEEERARQGLTHVRAPSRGDGSGQGAGPGR